MKTLRLLAAAVLLVAVGALLGGALNRAHAADAAATHQYTLRFGDKVSIPSIGQRCFLNGPSRPSLLCERRSKAHHSVQIFSSEMIVYKPVGTSAVPVWSGRP